MRRENRTNNIKKGNDKIIVYSIMVALVLVIAIFVLMLFTNNKNESEKYANLENNINSITSNTTKSENTESASTQIGKSVNEVSENTTTNTTNETSKNTVTSNTTSNTVVRNQNSSSNTKDKSNVTSTYINEDNDEKENIEFIKPVEGEISKEFAKEDLIYSDTLKEWTTHLGIDIKAEETSEVVAAQDGVVKSIKNDPRYGLTITIEHDDGYQTIYSNLLTAELVVEGENVEKGQTIATIGNTAAFEAKEETHLHFEILKDFEQVNPSDYIK